MKETRKQTIERLWPQMVKKFNFVFPTLKPIPSHYEKLGGKIFNY